MYTTVQNLGGKLIVKSFITEEDIFDEYPPISTQFWAPDPGTDFSVYDVPNMHVAVITATAWKVEVTYDLVENL